MAIDPHYIPAFSIEEVILDKDTGAPLAGGIVTFERSLQPGILKSVFQITGTDPNFSYIELPNPMVLSSIGTFVDSLGNPVVPYFLPYTGTGVPNFGDVDYYRVIVDSSGDVEQFVRDPVPYIPESGEMDIGSLMVNEISNPQFAVVNFPASPTVYNFTGGSNIVTNIAPNWDIIVSSLSTATVTVNQLTPVGTLNIVTNPGSILNINSTGLTSLILRQRITGSPNLWGNGFLSASFVAKTYNSLAVPLTMFYSQSNGILSSSPVTLINATLNPDGNYYQFPISPETGSVFIPLSGNTQHFPNAYIDIYFQLPLNTQVDITSVMVAGTGINEVDNISYDQTTYNRQIDQLYHYDYPIVPVGTIIDYFGFNVPDHYLLCDYSTYNRIDKQQLFNTITTTETVTLTMSSPDFTVANPSKYRIGMGLESPQIAAFTTIINISGSTITMSTVALGTATGPVRFFAAANIFIEFVDITMGVNTFTVVNPSLYGTGMAIGGYSGVLASPNPFADETTIVSVVGTTVTVSNPALVSSGVFQAQIFFYSPGNGDGATTFNVPDLRRRSTIGSGGVVLSDPNSFLNPISFGIGNQLGDLGGQELHLMLLSELVDHQHTGTGNYLEQVSGAYPLPTGSGAFNTVANTGGILGYTAQNEFNVVQPGIITNKCIRFE